ncbi:MAG: 23S rRNA (pseudouridine(1915)-N(3))-methyltransferase RlmH [Alphaproteobacteria bacterium]|nr:23S rRNA (pseudouridine(1915)-N(3))-methyltransferase RlmH [Alphaproteobacteria bacterium]
MHIIISAIGKLKKNSPEYALIETYLKRIKWTVDIKEYEEKKALAGDALKTAEGELLLSGVPEQAKIVALDEHGSTLSSREFANQLRMWQNKGSDTVVFLIGGADGHGKNVQEKADLTLSFGRMTLPHFLMRVVLAEQIYRAQTILAGHPYHRD